MKTYNRRWKKAHRGIPEDSQIGIYKAGKSQDTGMRASARKAARQANATEIHPAMKKKPIPRQTKQMRAQGRM